MFDLRLLWCHEITMQSDGVYSRGRTGVVNEGIVTVVVVVVVDEVVVVVSGTAVDTQKQEQAKINTWLNIQQALL